MTMTKTVVKKIPALRFPEFTGEWEEKVLGQMASFSKGKGISKADIDENGSLECVTYGELYTSYNELINEVKSRTNLKPDSLVLSDADDVIIPASGETHIDIATASCVLKAGVALGGDLNIIQSKADGVFLAYYLNNARKTHIARLAQGSSVIHLYSSQLKLLRLNLPPLPEQQKIAAFLSAVDTRIQQLTRKKALLEQYKKGVMQQVFSRQIRFKDDQGRAFPEWEEKRLSEALSVSNNRNYALSYGKEDVLSVSGEYGIVNQISFMGRSYAGESVANYHIVGHGDIVYTKSPLKANPYGIIKVNKGAAGIVSTLYAVYQVKKNSSGLYLEYYFQLDDNTNRYLRPLVRKGAKNDMKINNSHVLTGRISLPSLPEQQKIAAFLSALDVKIDQVGQQLQRMQTFKKGLLQQMFV